MSQASFIFPEVFASWASQVLVVSGCCWTGLPLMAILSLQADLFVMTWLLGFVDPTEPSFVAAVFTIVFSPLFWNVVSTVVPALASW